MFLSQMGNTLREMMIRKPSSVAAAYARPTDVPPVDELLARSWTWGDPFDDFLFALYDVESEQRVHFVWKLHGPSAKNFPDYPPGPHHAGVSYPVFDEVVRQFLDALGIT
jgi:hypothetical protein